VALVLDTGVLYAALDETDADHDACAALLTETQEQLVIPAPVLVELDYWIRKFATADAWLTFCEDISRGAYLLHQLDSAATVAAATLQAKYEDLRLGLVDASVLVTCEVMGEPKVATLDRRHFSVLRTEDGRTLEILPSPAT
jgi:predicted nucleic acid-binding protein